MQKIWLGFFIGVSIVAMPLLSNAQSNSMGDRAPVMAQEPNHKSYKPKISRRQKLLFRRPNVKHTAKYEYYHQVELMAREKQRIARKKTPMLKIPNMHYDAEYDFYKRIELAAIEKQRLLRKMDKPQYYDFAYFGHKHKPKRHLPYAMRYCKECGIRH